MNDKLFRDMLNLLIAAAENRRDALRVVDDHDAADRGSAVAGNLDYARQQLRR